MAKKRVFRRWVEFAGLLLGLASLAAATADTLEAQVQFTPEQLIYSSAWNETIQLDIDARNTGHYGALGTPAVPYIQLSILLPEDQVADSISVTTTGGDSIEALVDLVHNTIGSGDSIYPEERNAMAYDSANEIPSISAELVRTDNFNGYMIARINVYPVTYVPDGGQLAHRGQIDIEITTEDSGHSIDGPYALPGTPQYEEIKLVVDNPEDIDTYYPMGGVANPEAGDLTCPQEPMFSSTNIEYLLITTQALAPSFQPLVDWKIKKGVAAKLVTIEEIRMSTTGADTAEMIKSYLRSIYLTTGSRLRYVTLGGDDTLVPTRFCWVRYIGTINGVQQVLTYDQVGVDLYYASLREDSQHGSWTWDENHDGVFGQMDYTNSIFDNPRLYSDIAIGRIPARDSGEATAIVAKTLTYEKYSPPFDSAEESNVNTVSPFSSTLLLSTDDSSNVTGPGATYLKTKMNGIYLNKYWASPLTYGAKWPVYHIDDIGKSTFIEKLESGPNLLYIMAHGAYYAIQIDGLSTLFTTSDAYSLVNLNGDANPSGFSHILAASCEIGQFVPDQETVAEALIRNAYGGAVSITACGVMTISPNHVDYHKRYYEYLYTEENQSRRIGDAVAYMKNSNQGIAESVGGNNSGYRAMMYCFNLFGDAEVPVYMKDPQPIYAEISEMEAGEEVIEVDAGFEGATVCLWMENRLWLRDTTNSSGTATFEIDMLYPGTLHVTVTAPNHLPFEDDVIVAMPQYNVPGSYATIQEAIDDADADFGEVVVAVQMGGANTHHENIDFKGKNITVRSTSISPLDWPSIVPANSALPTVKFSGAEGCGAKLRGFTLKDGKVAIEGNETPASLEYVYVLDNVAPSPGVIQEVNGRIWKCVIADNECKDGSGNYVGTTVYNCDGPIEETTVQYNKARVGGGLAYCGGPITKCDILENDSIGSVATGQGLGGGLAYCGGRIFQSKIRRNSATDDGGGLYSCSGPITANKIYGNSAARGGGLALCGGLIQSNQIFGNSAVTTGSAIYVASQDIRNNTFARNNLTAPTAGGLLSSCSDSSIINNIFWSNTPSGTGESIDSEDVAYCLFDKWRSDGQYLIFGDPKFVNGTHNVLDQVDLNLTSCSPAIDAGMEILADPTDYNGTLRPVQAVRWQYETRGDGSHFDIGALEYDGAPSTTPPSTDSCAYAQALVPSPAKQTMFELTPSLSCATPSDLDGVISGLPDLWYYVYTERPGTQIAVEYTDTGSGSDKGYAAIMTGGCADYTVVASSTTRSTGKFSCQYTIPGSNNETPSDIFIRIGSEKQGSGQTLKVTITRPADEPPIALQGFIGFPLNSGMPLWSATPSLVLTSCNAQSVPVVNDVWYYVDVPLAGTTINAYWYDRATGSTPGFVGIFTGTPTSLSQRSCSMTRVVKGGSCPDDYFKCSFTTESNNQRLYINIGSQQTTHVSECEQQLLISKWQKTP